MRSLPACAEVWGFATSAEARADSAHLIGRSDEKFARVREIFGIIQTSAEVKADSARFFVKIRGKIAENSIQ